MLPRGQVKIFVEESSASGDMRRRSVAGLQGMNRHMVRVAAVQVGLTKARSSGLGLGSRIIRCFRSIIEEATAHQNAAFEDVREFN